MKVVLDCTTVPKKPAGAGRYALELARALATLAEDPANELELIVLERWGMLADLAGTRVEYRRIGPQDRWARVAWEQTALARLVRQSGADLYHSSHHSLPLLPVSARKVVTVHDLTFRLFPERYPAANRHYMRWATAASMQVADAVIVPSQAVRADLQTLDRPRTARLTVVPEGVSAEFARRWTPEQLRDLRGRYSLPERYLLQLGTNEPGKNRRTMIEAFELVRREHPDVGLALAGQQGWGQAPVLPAGAVDLGYVPQEDLPLLYAAAEVFVFPSLYEGFGLPILEAMASGTAVVTSAGGACAEVAGDAARIVQPLTAPALAEAIDEILQDEGLRANLAGRGRERASSFTWEAAARRTVDVYRQALAS